MKRVAERGDVFVQDLTPSGWTVEIESRGRGGSITYREDAGSVACSWEFCAGDVVATVMGPDPESWDARHPWAAGRRGEIMGRIGDEVIRQKAPRCRCEYDALRNWIVVLQT